MTQQLSFDLDTAPSLTPKRSPEIGAHDRCVIHHGVTVPYRLHRSRRRSIGLTVGDDGLRVTAPSWVSLRHIDEAVIEKFEWIQRKLQAIHVRHQKLALAASNWRAGGTLPYLGCRLVLRCGNAPEQPNPATVWFEGDPDAPQVNQALWLPLPEDVDSARLRDLSQAWLQQRAKAWFGKRLAHFKTTSGLGPSAWKLSSANTRWGTCNSDGRILLNWRLIHFEPVVIDYVIAHELAHLRVMNHSAAFWDVLQTIYPDYLAGHRALSGVSPGDMPAV
jgi:predicted metal-dependent hydrolase